MTLTVSSKRIDTPEHGSSDQNQQRTYSVSFRIKQTDSGSRAGAQAMITAAQALMSGDPPPVYGDVYSYDGDTDNDSYAQSFTWQRQNPSDNERILVLEVGYMPVGGGGGGATHGRLIETDPLSWEVTRRTEWIQEQVVLEGARNVDEFPGIARAALTDGPVVNTCGIEFGEGAMKTVEYPIKIFTKPYETQEDIDLLNYTYRGTTNDGVFLGSPARTCKYLGTESGGLQKINGQEFYMGITRIQVKSDTWDRQILNNGWSHFKIDNDHSPSPDYYRDSNGNPKLFPNNVNREDDLSLSDPSQDTTERCSEPQNLAMTGVVRSDGPIFVSYRDLAEVDYTGIGIGG